MKEIEHILVASDLASYRESIAAVLRASLPRTAVSEAASVDLNREVLRLRPDLVICSRVNSVVEDRVPNWIELHPDCRPFSTFCLAGERSVKEQVNLSDLLSVVDRTAVRTG